MISFPYWRRNLEVGGRRLLGSGVTFHDSESCGFRLPDRRRAKVRVKSNPEDLHSQNVKEPFPDAKKTNYASFLLPLFILTLCNCKLKEWNSKFYEILPY
jgi:hypothetical protein